MRANHIDPVYGHPDTRQSTARDALRTVAHRLAALLRLWRRRRRERRELAEFARLDARMLADIGLTRESAEFLLSRSRFETETPVRHRSSRAIKFARAILHALLERLGSARRDIPPEFIRYPFP